MWIQDKKHLCSVSHLILLIKPQFFALKTKHAEWKNKDEPHSKKMQIMKLPQRQIIALSMAHTKLKPINPSSDQQGALRTQAALHCNQWDDKSVSKMFA